MQAEEAVDFASGRGYSKGQLCKFAKQFLPKFRKQSLCLSDRYQDCVHFYDFTCEIICTEIHDFRKFLFTMKFRSENKVVNFDFRTSETLFQLPGPGSSRQSPPQPGQAMTTRATP